MGEIGRARPQFDRPGFGREARKEDHAACDILIFVGQMFADEGIVEAEPVREQHRLSVLAQGFVPRPVGGMHRHREISKFHRNSLLTR